MFTRLSTILAFALLPAVPGLTDEPYVIAVLDLKFLRTTDRVAATLCLEDESETQCFPWAHHYLWEARVVQVLSGHLPSKKFKVLFGRHALLEKDLKNVVVTLLARDPKTSLGASFEVRERASTPKLACFDVVTDLPSVRILDEDVEKTCVDLNAVSEQQDETTLQPGTLSGQGHR